ncbi:MAG: lysophospholipid acyltransferase family protein [Pyrinomonadaceae bacterium]
MAKKSKPLVWLEYAAARGLLGTLGVLPRRAAVAVSMSLAAAGYYALGGLRRVAMTNLRIAFPEKDSREHKRLAKGAFRNLGRILGELSQFPKATPESLNELIEFQVDADVYAEYQRLKSEGRGVIIVSPHLGNWEMLVFGWAVYDAPMSYLARRLDNPLIEKLTSDLRRKFGNTPINKANSAMAAARVLRNEGLLGILADVNAHPKEGVFVPFFGIPACTSSGVALLAMRTNSAIVPMCGAWDEEKQHYIGVHGRVIYPADTGDRKQDIVATTAEFTAEVEKLVRRFPDQWLWIHKRWKTRPPGEDDLYRS